MNDGNDQDLLDALMEQVQEKAWLVVYKEYDKPGNHGEEPPEEVTGTIKDSMLLLDQLTNRFHILMLGPRPFPLQ